MVNHHFKQHIRPNLIKEAMKYLIGKYPFYEGLDFDDDKLNRLKVNFFDDDENDSEEILDFNDWIEVENVAEEKKNDAMDDVQEEENEEENYNKNDAVKKFQTDVSSSSFLIPENIPSKINAKKKSKEGKETEKFVFAPAGRGNGSHQYFKGKTSVCSTISISISNRKGRPS